MAPNEQVDLNNINYPIYASCKLDGIRCLTVGGQLVSRTLKPIRNKVLQERYKELCKIAQEKNMVFDGELYSHELTFQKITHFVMSEETEDEVPNCLKFHCFDILFLDKEKDFFERINHLSILKNNNLFKNVIIVTQNTVASKEEIDKYFEGVIQRGYEGLILKDIKGKYKQGRGTVKEGLIYKVKPFETFDMEIKDIYERVENLVESKIDKLGYKKKAKHKGVTALTGIAGGFIGICNGQEQKVTLTGDEEFRKEIWQNKEKYIGRWIEFKGMKIGSKDKIRHPTFIRFREGK
ncbi:hypothetical protein KKG81_04680 [bacterium]|nr:hypothetical protein [bacterium]